MRKFWIYLRANLQMMSTYRGDICVWTLSSAIVPFVSLAVWSVVATNTSLPLSKNELIIYFLFVYIVELLTNAWGGHFLILDIKNGSFSKYLIKPVSVILDHASSNLGEKITKLIFALFSISVIYIVFLSRYNISFQPDIWQVLLFILSLVLAAASAFLFDMIIGLLTFWVHDAEFLRSFYLIVKGFFSGVIIPVILFPELLSNLSLYLPFRYQISFPIEIIMGQVLDSSLVFGFIIQIIWFLVAYALYKIVFEHGIKRHQGYGA